MRPNDESMPGAGDLMAPPPAKTQPPAGQRMYEGEKSDAWVSLNFCVLLLSVTKAAKLRETARSRSRVTYEYGGILLYRASNNLIRN